MKLKSRALRTIVRPSHVAAIAALIGVALIGAANERQSREVQRQAEREAVLERTTLMRSELQRVIGSNLQLVRGYAAVVSLEPDMSTERMSALAAEVMQGSEDIRAIVVAPDLVVSMVYPLEGNAHLLGRDYRTEHYRAALQRPRLRHEHARRADRPRERRARLRGPDAGLHRRRRRTAAVLGPRLAGDRRRRRCFAEAGSAIPRCRSTSRWSTRDRGRRADRRRPGGRWPAIR